MLFKEPSLMLSGYGSGTAIVLSGIQSTAYGQALGLLPVLREHFKWVIGYDYNNVSWRYPERLAADFAEIAAYWQRNSGSVVPVGLSLGAPLSVLITDAMRKLAVRQAESNQYPSDRRAVVEDSQRYRVVMIDPPFGAPTMMGVPPWMSASHLAHPFFTLGGAVVPRGVKLPGEPEVPTDEQLLLPTFSDMDVMFPGVLDAATHEASYRAFARAADVENQMNHSLRTWLQQLAWLTGGATRLPFKTMEGVRVDLITAKSSHNTVVRSEMAEARWRKAVGFTRVLNVDAEHAATLRHQAVYAAALRELLSQN